ncbi:MAG: DNA polymerase III subunit delta [Clostridia bacterium]|nr:DNA polymerase III subunit delta [Clostridia bacterium]
MKFTELKNSIAEGAKSVYLLEGDDAYFRRKGEEMLKAAFLQFPELNFSSFEGETLKGGGVNALVSAVKNYPFMSETRLVKVTEFYPSDSDFENYLKPLIEDFPQSAILIIINAGAKKGVDLKRKHAVTYVDCNRSDTETVARWAYITLKRAGVTASTAVCESIAAYCLADMSRVSVEVEKLIAFKSGGTLTQADVDDLVFKDADYKLYELTNTVARRDFNKFCLILSELTGKNGDEIYILNGLFNYFKNLLTVLTSRDSDASLAATLKMKEYGVKKSREQAEIIGEKKLSLYVRGIYSVISEVKSGQTTPQNALQTAQNLIFFGSV